MLFNSLIFIFVFLPALLVLYYAARRFVSHSTALFVLTVGSLVFYSWWDIRNLPILLGSAVGNYLLGVLIARTHSRPLMVFAIAANLALLGFYKYARFLGTIVGVDIASSEIPLGISFFTFQQISFLTDVWVGRTRPTKLVPHVLFVSFFPHLIAGPLVQHKQIAHQFANATRKDDIWDNLGVGLSMFAVGLGKKVLLADNLEAYAASTFGGAAGGIVPGLPDAWMGALAYSLQIFFDFSGYSDMAMGLARCFGYHLPINFNAPYRSASIVEFWRRWHISLSQFLRDHLYIPLGGNRRGEAMRYVNLMITMLLGGLWHGAGWTFVIWGGLHGAMLCVGHLWERFKLPKLSVRLGRPLMTGVTFLAVTFAWIFFRSPNFATAGRIFEGMFGAGGFGATVDYAGFALIAFGLALIWGVPDTPSLFYDRLHPDMIETARLSKPPSRALRWLPRAPIAVGLSVLLWVCVMNASKVAPFIYFQF